MGWKTLRFEQRMTSRGEQLVECWLDENGRPLQLLEVIPVKDQMEAPSVIVNCRNRYEHLTWRH